MEKCDECGRSFDTPQALGSHVGQAHGGNPNVKCETCGTEFEKVLSKVKKNQRHFCSNECRIEWFRTNDKRSVRGKITYRCSICGSDVERWPSEVQEFVCCSEECHGELMGELFSGQGNHNWKKDFTPEYGEKWEDTRESIIQRDDNRCQICGVERRDVVVDLHVHHLTPLRTFDSIERANREENLITLCNSCHATIENLNLEENEVLEASEQGSLAAFM